MKTRNILSLFLLITFQSAYSEITQPTYQIAKWFDDKKAAVSVNFDDNLPGQFSTALPIMNAKGVKGTFYVITNTASSQWSVLQTAINDGHEVGSHSVSHPTDLNFPSLAQPQKEVEIEKELKNSHDAIMANLTGQTSLSISWPFGKGGGGSDSIVRRVAKKYYFAARNTTAGTTNGDAYTHFANTWFSAFGRDYYLQSGGILMASTTTKANIGTFITEIIKVNGWFSPYYHAINQAGGYNNVTTELFQQHIDTIASRSEDLWITPFGNASKYHHERNVGAATLTAINENASDWTLNLTDNLDNAIFNQPLTILLNEPAFSIESISQNSINIPFTENNGIIKFSAVPDGGTISIKKDVGASSEKNIENQSLVLCFNDHAYLLKVNNTFKKVTRISIFDSKGRLIKILNKNAMNEGVHTFDIVKNQFSKGMFILQIEGTYRKSFKFVIN
ncbi:MAG: polysaccharide deacetylase family protein [Bacteroidales bacterium]